MSDQLPDIPNLPKVDIKITEKYDVGAFCTGLGGGLVVTFLLTHDPNLAAYIASATGTLLFGLKRSGEGILARVSRRSDHKRERLRQGYVSRVKWGVAVLEAKRDAEGLDAREVEDLRDLKAIETRKLYDIGLMEQVLGRTMIERIGGPGRTELEGSPKNRR